MGGIATIRTFYTPMTDAPAFDFYPERWTHGTRCMSKIERCDYLDLLCHQWTCDGLPDDMTIISRILGYKKASQIPQIVIEKFPLSDDGKRRNKRLEIEREKQRDRIEKRRNGAKITNAKRWNSESLASRSAIAQRVASESPPPTTHPTPLEYTYPEPNTPRSQDGECPAGGTGGIPPVTIEQAKQHGPSMGVIPEASEQWWLDNDARGWVDRSGQPVRNWRSSLTAYGRRWEANRRRNGTAAIPAKKDTDLF